jgi:predicted transcriptional regulator
MGYYLGRSKPAPVEGRPARAIVLRRARIDAGLTQHDLARLSGTQQSTIARCESGRMTLTDARLAFLLRVIAESRP